VPVGTERFRLTPSPVHTEEMMVQLRDALVELWQEFNIPLFQDVPALLAQAAAKEQLTKKKKSQELPKETPVEDIRITKKDLDVGEIVLEPVTVSISA